MAPISLDSRNCADWSFLQTTLDHAIWFYACMISIAISIHNSRYTSAIISTGDWLLFEVRIRHDQRGPPNLTNRANRLEPLMPDRGGF